MPGPGELPAQQLARVIGREAGLGKTMLPAAAGLPGRQAQALSGALGLAADPVAPDPLLTGVAVLTLLPDLSAMGRSASAPSPCSSSSRAAS